MKNKYLRKYTIQYLAILVIAIFNVSCCITGYCQIDNPQGKNENQVKYNTNQE